VLIFRRASSWVAGPSSHAPAYGQRHNDRDDYQERRPDRPERDREAIPYGDRSAVFGSSVELQFSNPEEAEAAFMKVLKQLKVQPDWEWTRAMRAGIKDPNWRAIPEPEKRHEAFKRYCEDLRAQEKNKEQERQAKMRVDFTAMLRSHPEIVHFTRWKTALPIIEDESIFRAAKDDSERRQLFEEYIITLKRAHAEKESEDKKSALEELTNVLNQLELEPFTRWHTAEEKLQENEQFNSVKFRTLGRLDVLTSFQKHIKQLQREHNDHVQLERRAKYRLERQNRDAFKILLNELKASGRLKAGTKWKEIHPIIEDDPRFLAMLGQNGSSPIELFWDVLEEEEGKFRTLRRYALDVLEQQRFEVVTATTFEEFLAVMRIDPRTAKIDDSSMSSIYNYVITKVKKREEEERRDVEHNERHAMDDLRSVLKHLDPPIAIADTWETTQARVEKTAEFRALKSDALRQSVFDKYVRRMKEKESDRRERSRRDPRDRGERGDRDRRERDREYRNGHSDSHRRHRTRTRSPEQDPYAAERRLAQQERESRYRNNESTGLSPPYRRDRERSERVERDEHRYERSRQGSGDHYVRERREREVERERLYVSRADPRERSVSELDYGGEPRPLPARRRRESDESASARRDNKVSQKSSEA
jgi:pre-mRNA-processing factor 40